MAPVNVVCIKWGTKYPAYYVNRLYGGVARFLKRPFRFLCFTEHAEGIVHGVEVHPLPVEPFETEMLRLMREPKRKGAWRKISLFRPGLAGMEGPVLGFDIDVAITGALDDLFDFAPGKVAMRHDWLEARRGRPGGHGSVFRFDPALHGYLYDEFAADPDGAALRSKGSEQKYTSSTAQAHGDFAYLPPEWIASFKRDSIHYPPLNLLLEPRLPKGTRVMCFHGTPKMEEALGGYRGEWFRTTKPARWLKTYWLGEN
ncbi:MAG: hypothetical protein WDM84_04180 [Bauldia sp.]